MITVPEIQLKLKRMYLSTSMVMAPNIFLYPSFESDFIRVSKSGYAIEYEIKLSRSDFKADFNKSKGVYVREENRHICKQITKHEWLVSGQGPTEFYYVFPELLIKANEVPDFAGIVEAKLIAKTEYFHEYVSLKVIRKAKRLNKKPLTDEKIRQIYASCYYRYWNEIEKRGANINQMLML